MTARCIICERGQFNNFIGGLKKCANCGLVLFDLDLTDEAIKAFYEKDYFFGRCYVDYIREKRALQLNFRKHLKELLYHVDSPKQKALFEIGCAYGFFLELAKKEFGFVQGIDISEDGCEYAREKLGLNVVRGDFIKFDIEKNKFDIFCLWGTIEHLKNPHLYLEKIRDCIKKDGIISLTTGDIESTTAKLSKDKWRLIQPPEHLFYFSRKTISSLLKKYGFEIVRIEYCGYYRTLHFLFLKHQNSIVYKLLKNIALTNTPFYLNLFDTMHLIAKKR